MMLLLAEIKSNVALFGLKVESVSMRTKCCALCTMFNLNWNMLNSKHRIVMCLFGACGCLDARTKLRPLNVQSLNAFQRSMKSCSYGRIDSIIDKDSRSRNWWRENPCFHCIEKCISSPHHIRIITFHAKIPMPKQLNPKRKRNINSKSNKCYNFGHSSFDGKYTNAHTHTLFIIYIRNIVLDHCQIKYLPKLHFL